MSTSLSVSSSVAQGRCDQSQPGPSGIESIILFEPPPAKRKKKLGTIFKEQEEADHEPSLASLSPEHKCKNEIEKYLGIPILDFEDDPLLWWNGSFQSFPILSAQARKYLCICATSSPSERVFSCSGKIISPLRTSLKPDKVDMLTFLSRNLK